VSITYDQQRQLQLRTPLIDIVVDHLPQKVELPCSSHDVGLRFHRKPGLAHVQDGRKHVHEGRKTLMLGINIATRLG